MNRVIALLVLIGLAGTSSAEENATRVVWTPKPSYGELLDPFLVGKQPPPCGQEVERGAWEYVYKLHDIGIELIDNNTKIRGADDNMVDHRKDGDYVIGYYNWYQKAKSHKGKIQIRISVRLTTVKDMRAVNIKYTDMDLDSPHYGCGREWFGFADHSFRERNEGLLANDSKKGK